MFSFLPAIFRSYSSSNAGEYVMTAMQRAGSRGVCGILLGIFLLTPHATAQYYTFTFSGKLTQVIDNYGKLAATGMAPGSSFDGYFTYDTSAAPWYTPPWAGNFTYEWVKAYRFTVHTAQGDYTFGYVDSSRAFYQVDVRNYDKLWWGQSGINGSVAKTDFPSQRGTYAVGFNLSNTASNIWDVAYPLPSSLRANDFDIREVSFHGYDSTNQIDYRVVGQIDIEAATLAHTANRWYLRSVSIVPSEYAASSIFPGTTSGVWGYLNGLYTIEDTLHLGEGYWVKYPSDGATTISGLSTLLEVSRSIVVPPGGCWILLGTTAVALPLSSIVVSGAATLSGMIFAFDGVTYYPATTLEPWHGYWLKLAAVDAGGPAVITLR
jgi:hypothetical protein